MNRLCKVGDVIRCDDFRTWQPDAEGYYSMSDTVPYVCGNEWLVVKTSVSGGGTAHGPHDVYPDGHRVFCHMFHGFNRESGQPKINETFGLKFYQTGCFIGMLPPEKIDLVQELAVEKPRWARV